MVKHWYIGVKHVRGEAEEVLDNAKVLGVATEWVVDE